MAWHLYFGHLSPTLAVIFTEICIEFFISREAWRPRERLVLSLDQYLKPREAPRRSPGSSPAHPAECPAQARTP